MQYRFEGQHLQTLKKGTASAESVTLSFWVKSVKTGTFTAQLLDGDNSRTISQTYTVDSGSTWEKKTLTFAGDTTGAFNNDNAISMTILLWLAAGSNWTSGTLATSWAASGVVADWVSSSQVNIADSTSNDFWITGLQLEVGSSATDFEHVPYDYQLSRCQRYFRRGRKGLPISVDSSTKVWVNGAMAPEMRATATVTLVVDTPSVIIGTSAAGATGATIEQDTSSTSALKCRITGFTSLTAGQTGFMNTLEALNIDAEL
jgi:hypothetical protein